MAGPVDNPGYELAAAGAELLLEFELEPFDELEPDEPDELELDESELDESEDDEAPTDSLLFADPLDELPLELVAFSRLSLR
ncbi:MAG: hypothetical protein QOF25_2849 [Mycobacterium sp.]|jgi:hypothetical protein|nr:hypothetical protein [Mycobacterium sp.]